MSDDSLRDALKQAMYDLGLHLHADRIVDAFLDTLADRADEWGRCRRGYRRSGRPSWHCWPFGLSGGSSMRHRMSETLGEMRERLARDVENLPWLVRWLFRRRLHKINQRLDRERDRVIRAYFTGER